MTRSAKSTNRRSTNRDGPFWAQAPVNGVPKRVGDTPGEANCEMVIFEDGVFVKTGDVFKIRNDFPSVAAAEGDRLFRITGYFPGAWVDTWDCENDGDPGDIGDRPAP